MCHEVELNCLGEIEILTAYTKDEHHLLNNMFVTYTYSNIRHYS